MQENKNHDIIIAVMILAVILTASALAYQTYKTSKLETENSILIKLNNLAVKNYNLCAQIVNNYSDNTTKLGYLKEVEE